MTDPPMPPRGTMVLYDRLDPALPDGEYTLSIATDVSLSGAVLADATRQFNVEGPRFSLAPTEVAGVFPPRNARGEFSDALPHIALGRRTLPWERSADPAGRLPPTTIRSTDPPLMGGTTPWLALLLFDETETPEVTVLSQQAVTDVLPASVIADLKAPSDAKCDAIEVSQSLLEKIMPTVQELHLLTHARQVNVDDRELSAGDSDGWFSVVMASRAPLDGRKYRVCLVSVEGRSDLLTTVEPDVATSGAVFHPPGDTTAGGLDGVGPTPEPDGGIGVDVGAGAGVGVGAGVAVLAPHAAPVIGPASAVAGARAIGLASEVSAFLPGDFVIFEPKVRLVLLHSWNFECEGSGTFQQLAEHLDVGMIGAVREEWPKVTDTGHLPIDSRDRAGALATAWYRGPLAPLPISRDTRGPYHSADQARRVSAETGLEDISYAVAFEVGRLLAASDARLAQELMRWRRGDYQHALVGLQHGRLRDVLGDVDRFFLMASVAARLLGRWTDPSVPVIDPFEFDSFASAPGLDAAQLARAWGVSAERATEILSDQVAALAVAVDTSVVAASGPVTLQGVAGDVEGLATLAGVRTDAMAQGSAFMPSGFEGPSGFGGGVR